MFSTIRGVNNGKLELYHGYLFEQRENDFTFAFRMGNRNYIWDCKYSDWELLV